MAENLTSGHILSVEQLKKHSKIYAGPGAGKTHFLVENVKNIVSTNPLIAGSRERKILCITYTNAAVDEIKERLDRFSKAVSIHTIHGFIIEHIIGYFQHDLKNLMDADFGIKVRTSGKITSQVEGLSVLSGIERADIYNFLGGGDEIGYSKSVMGSVQIDTAAYVDNNVSKLKASSKISESHINLLKQFIWAKAKKLSHDEILYFGYRILKSNPTALYAIRVRFPFVFVDEFQDTSPLQTMLIRLIGEKSTVVGVIGDVAQSIYSFQGATPSQFLHFNDLNNTKIAEYSIEGNRRSTESIVSFCNFLRASDSIVYQHSIVCDDEVDTPNISHKKVCVLMGDDANISKRIESIVDSGGVILTRTWASAFAYIKNIMPQQEKVLKKITNAYYPTSIDIRKDISEHTRVTWVKAFKFIFGLWRGYTTGAFLEVLNALSLIAEVDKEKIDVKILSQIKKLSQELFSKISGNFENVTTVEVIEHLNQMLTCHEYADFAKLILTGENSIRIFNELERDDIKESVALLTWGTSHRLFTEVFSEDSVYMTVHQAKGREWDKVIVSLEPNRFDKTSINSMFAKPSILQETPCDEFTRMYYVACSRAKKELFLHLKNLADVATLKTSMSSYNQNRNDGIVDVEYFPQNEAIE